MSEGQNPPPPLTNDHSSFDSFPSAPSQKIDSSSPVRELNRLLESALRMGGHLGIEQEDASKTIDNVALTENANFPLSGGDPAGIDENNAYTASESTTTWRLDTARRLSLLLSYHKNHSPTNDADDNLLPALRRQSRYWTPLLLSWLKGAGNSNEDNQSPNTNSDYKNNNSLDLPLPINRRQRKIAPSPSSSSSVSDKVPIEALRALTSLVSLTFPGGDPPSSTDLPHSSNITGGIPPLCSPHVPLSTTAQRLLLRHSDAVPMIVSLLQSPEGGVFEQAAWMLGSIAASGLGGAILPTCSGAAGSGFEEEQGVINKVEAAEEKTSVIAKQCNLGSYSLNGNNHVADPSASSLVESNTNTGKSTDPLLSSSGNSKMDSVSARGVLFAAGALKPLLKCLAGHPENIPLQRVGAWCLSSLVEGRYSTSSTSSSTNANDCTGSNVGARKRGEGVDEIDALTLLPTLRRFLNMSDAEVLTFACWTLSHLCDGPSYHIAAIIYLNDDLPSLMLQEHRGRFGKRERRTVMNPVNGLVPRLVELLLHSSPKVAKPALRTIGNIVCADCTDQQQPPPLHYDDNGELRPSFPVVDFTEIILECNAVPHLRRLIGHHHREIQKEACWTLSNIAAGTAGQIQAVIDSGAIAPLVELVGNDNTDKEVRSEACWVVLNATSCGNDAQISTLVDKGCVGVLGVLLAEPNMVTMALEGIERVLQTEEARDSEDLCHTSEEELSQRPAILQCASLVQSVVESPHNTSAVSKRAGRIWEHHFVSCALCRNHYSRCRLRDSRFCNECKCYVCSRCDCRVYHLSYQEELWAESEERAVESKEKKKSKKAKKRQKAKERAAEKKRMEEVVLKEQERQQEPEAKASAFSKSGVSNAAQAFTNGKILKMYKSQNTSKGCDEASSKGGNEKVTAISNNWSATQYFSPTPPSRSTIESCPPTGSFLGNVDDAEIRDNDITSGNTSTEKNMVGGRDVDLVLYLQQTGSIIALAKLMDSLYDNEYMESDDDVGDEDNIRGQSKGGREINQCVLRT